jgi:hypothetical protein
MKVANGSFLLILVLLLSSCSVANHKEEKSTKVDDAVGFEQRPSVEAESREPVFVYNNQSAKLPKRIFLALNEKPQLLADGYTRLIGVVMGSTCRVALVEMAGQEKCLRQGEDWGEYRVANITEKGIKLVRKEK